MRRRRRGGAEGVLSFRKSHNLFIYSLSIYQVDLLTNRLINQSINQLMLAFETSNLTSDSPD